MVRRPPFNSCQVESNAYSSYCGLMITAANGTACLVLETSYCSLGNLFGEIRKYKALRPLGKGSCSHDKLVIRAIEQRGNICEPEKTKRIQDGDADLVYAFLEGQH